MGTLLVAAFDDEGGAHAGAHALRALHAEGVVTLYALAVVARGARGGGVAVREPMAEGTGAAAPVVGAAVGALVALLGGPLAAVGRTVDGALVGAVRDLAEAGLDGGFLERVSRRLRPGGGAVLGHVEEGGPLPIDSCVAALGGRVLRHGIVGAAPEERIVHEVAALRAALAGLRGDRPGVEAPAAVWTLQRTRAAELRRALARAEALARALRREAAAKVAVLRAQAAGLDGAARPAVEDRAGAVRAALEARAARLDRLVEDLAWPAAPSTPPRRPPRA
jgi:uncharacterized membrane protein